MTPRQKALAASSPGIAVLLYGLVATAWCYRVELGRWVRCWPVKP